MGLLTFALNVTLDGCWDHREGVANDDLDHIKDGADPGELGQYLSGRF